MRWHHFIVDGADGVIQHPDYEHERLIHMRYRYSLNGSFSWDVAPTLAFSEGDLGLPRGRWQLAEIPESVRNDS